MRDLKDCVVYDVEVVNGPDEIPGGWENPEGMGFASGVTYDYATDLYEFFMHEAGAEALRKKLTNRIAVSFNGIKFDSKVMLGNDRECKQGFTFTSDSAYMWFNFDILLEYIKGRFGYETVAEAEDRLGDRKIHDGSFNLDALCKATLGAGKTGHGAHAPVLYQKKQYDALLAYNFNDVRISKKLFDFIRKYGFVVDGNGNATRIIWSD
ncbi:MAG TPA: hypothetical protein DDW42_01655 [Desulfobacteraceae bacterium]|nr:hypothetical protein [Desulfobacteraceae bacterium]